MEMVICNNENEWVEKISTRFFQDVQKYQARSVFLPAGETPRPLYSHWTALRPHGLAGLRLIQVDEVLDGEKRFQNFFLQTLPHQVSQFEWIDNAGSLADGCVLGLGTNGHVAFHEPSLPDHFFSGCLRMDLDTCHRLKIPDATWGVSYGLDAFLRAKFIYLIVRGPSKKKILERILEPSCDLPAGKIVQSRKTTIFYCPAEA